MHNPKTEERDEWGRNIEGQKPCCDACKKNGHGNKDRPCAPCGIDKGRPMRFG